MNSALMDQTAWVKESESLPELPFATAAKTPNHIAITISDTRIPYAALATRVRMFAQGLLNRESVPVILSRCFCQTHRCMWMNARAAANGVANVQRAKAASLQFIPYAVASRRNCDA